MKPILGEHCVTVVHRSTVTGELFVLFVLPANGKFKAGDRVEIGVIHKPRLAAPETGGL